MVLRKIQIGIAIAIVSCAAYVTWVLVSNYFEREAFIADVGSYSGDGKISNISFTFFMMNVIGYRIEFDEFHLTQAFNEDYVLEDLPDLGNELIVYLKACGIDENKPAGEFALSVKDSDGRIVTKLPPAAITGLTWSSNGGDPCFYIYDYPGSRMEVEEGERYTCQSRLIR